LLLNGSPILAKPVRPPARLPLTACAIEQDLHLAGLEVVVMVNPGRLDPIATKRQSNTDENGLLERGIYPSSAAL
jgi:hypothetical protein